MTRGWKVLTVLAPLIASASLFITVLLWTEIQDSRRSSRADSAKSDRIICQRQNALKRNIRAVLRARIEEPQARIQSLRHFRDTDCSALPSQGGLPE